MYNNTIPLMKNNLALVDKFTLVNVNSTGLPKMLLEVSPMKQTRATSDIPWADRLLESISRA
jgi:hypothetical protein